MRSPTKTPRHCPTTPRSPSARTRRAPGSKTCATASAPNSRRSRTSSPARTASCRPAASSARPGSASRGAERRGSRRRHHVDHARPRVREGRRQRLDRVRRIQPGVPQADPGRRAGSALLRLGHLAGGAHALAQGAGGAHEHPLHRHHARLVRRRRRPHADGAARRRHARRSTPRSRPPATRTTPATTRASRNGATSTSICRIAARRAASAASSTTISTAATSRATSPSPAPSARPSSTSIPQIVRRHMNEPWTAGRARAPAGAPRPLRRVQPAARPRHQVRPDDRRQRRGDPDVPAARGALAVSGARARAG